MITRRTITNRSEWLEWRKQYITASDVPAAVGEGIYGSAAQLWATKRGLVAPLADNAVLRRGRWMGAATFEALSEERPNWDLRRAKVFLSDDEARLAATPDGVAVDPERDGIGIIQAKSVARSVFIRDWRAGESDDDAPISAPFAFQLQTLTEAMLADASWAIIAALVQDSYDFQLYIIPVERHPNAEAMIRERVADFQRDYLDPGICPPIDPTRDEELIKTLFPRDDGTEIDLSDDNRIPELVAQRAAKKEVLKSLNRDLIALETEIKAKLGPHSYARLADGRVISHKQQHRSGFTVAPTSFRVLRISNA